MKKKLLKKVFFICLLTIGLISLTTIVSNAATSISISVSKTSVSPGGTFTVTVSAVGAGPVTTTVSNGSGGKTEFLDNSSYSFTCTAGSSGSVTISASGLLGDYETGDEANKSASRTVKIVQSSSNNSGVSNSKPATTKPVEVKKSNNSNLKELVIKDLVITPEFKKDIKEYALTVPNEITKLEITANPEDSKANVTITGNEELLEGENSINVIVTAEDGSKTSYVIKVTRQKPKLSLSTLVIKYQNENGELVETTLTPVFNFDVLEYSLPELEYWVEKLNVEATSNREEATIDIQGIDGLKVGENVITITAKLPVTEETEEEIITYTIKVNKKEEPTLIAKISNWFKGILGTVTSWYTNNTSGIVFGLLAACIISLLGLSIYIIIDYNKYKDIIAKAKEISKAEFAAEGTIVNNSENTDNKKEDIEKLETENIEAEDKKVKGGKHF